MSGGPKFIRLRNGDYVNAVEYRFTNTTGVQILYNLTDAAITPGSDARLGPTTFAEWLAVNKK